MNIETILMIVSIVLLTIITVVMLGAVAAVFIIRKKLKSLPIGKFGGVMSILPILKFILGRRKAMRR
jgi:hypothetical protein